MLSDRLPASIQKLVEPQIFPLPSSHDSIDRVFEHCVSVPGNHLYPGPSLCEMLVARQHEHAVDIESFIQSLKVAHHIPFLLSQLTRAVCVHEPLLRQLSQCLP